MFPKRLNAARKMRHLTALQMANFLNVALRTYRFYESGAHFPPQKTLIKICDILDVSADYLLGRDDVPNRRAKG